MKCEIEFLPVGEASKAGDAIVVRYGEENAFELMVIDGGSIESGKWSSNTSGNTSDRIASFPMPSSRILMETTHAGYVKFSP